MTVLNIASCACVIYQNIKKLDERLADITVTNNIKVKLLNLNFRILYRFTVHWAGKRRS